MSVNAQYSGKPNCEAIQDVGLRLQCMDENADCATPSWLSAASRAECLAEENAKTQGLGTLRSKALQGALSPKERVKFKAAEAAYTRYVRLQCEFEAEHVSGGSMYPNELNTCMLRLKNERVADYERMHENAKVIQNR